MTEDQMLIEKAKQAQQFAYAPYSLFLVGAAVLTESGKVYTGCNIENASFGATNCAERTAIFKAVSEGEKKIKKIAITSNSGKLTFPCGICRQVLTEFMEKEGIVLLESDGAIQKFRWSELLPHAFCLEQEERMNFDSEE